MAQSFRPVTALIVLLVFMGAAACAQAPEKVKPKAPEKVAPSGGMDVKDLFDRMETARKKLAGSKHKTLRAKVTKTRQIVILDETETFKGTIEFKMPRLLRLRLKNVENDRETIVIVGKKYGWIYRVHRKQAERAALPPVDDTGRKNRSANPLEYGLSRSIHGLEEAYHPAVKLAEKVGTREAIPLVLVPRAGDKYTLSKIIFWIDTTLWLPIQLREHKSNDEIIETHTFTDIELDVKVKNKIFDFDPPKGVDVIDHDDK